LTKLFFKDSRIPREEVPYHCVGIFFVQKKLDNIQQFCQNCQVACYIQATFCRQNGTSDRADGSYLYPLTAVIKNNLMTQNDQLPKLANTNLWRVREEILQRRLEQDIIRRFLAIRKEIEKLYD
jgi:hypothetical protein